MQPSKPLIEKGTVSALILAAGKSSRAPKFKPLEDWYGETFISKVYRSLEGCLKLREILVVTGFQEPMLAPALVSMGANQILNPNFELGMHSSIRVGLKGLRPGWGGVLIALVDQPQLDSADYARLIDGFSRSAHGLLRPTYRGKRGNPSIIGAKYFDEILAEPDRDQGCAYLFNRHPLDVELIEMSDDKCLVDFDAGIVNRAKPIL